MISQITMKNKTLFLCFCFSSLFFLSACDEGEIRVATGDVTNILSTTANVTGEILSTGDGIKQYGHCYSKTPDPDVSDTRTEYYVTIGAGRYTSFLQGLEPGTKYYIKAYGSNDSETAYGAEISFTTSIAGNP